MGRAINKLTAVKVSKLNKRGRYGDGGGLYANVSPSLGIAWVYRWTPRGGKPREMGLGSYPAVSLAEARKKAVICREHAAAGRDPKAERDKSFGHNLLKASEEYLAVFASKWSNEKTAWQWRDSLVNRTKSLHNRPVAQIDTNDVLSILKPIWQATPETASRVRMRIENLLDFAKTKGWREGENPARWKGHLENILPARDKSDKNHHASLHYNDIAGFMLSLRSREALAARALELLILTTTRTSEVLNATWDEIDLDAALWIIPKERMKASKQHRIPLSKAAVDLLTPLSNNRISNYVFPSQKPNKPFSNMAMATVLKRMKYKDITVHGFRSTFRNWCGDKTNTPREIAEAALAHQLGDSVELAYHTADALEKRRHLMETWADYCIGNTGEKVVAFYG